MSLNLPRNPTWTLHICRRHVLTIHKEVVPSYPPLECELCLNVKKPQTPNLMRATLVASPRGICQKILRTFSQNLNSMWRDKITSWVPFLPRNTPPPVRFILGYRGLIHGELKVCSKKGTVAEPMMTQNLQALRLIAWGDEAVILLHDPGVQA